MMVGRLCVVELPDAGAAMVTPGAKESQVTVTVADAVRPAASIAVAVIVLEPWLKATVAE